MAQYKQLTYKVLLVEVQGLFNILKIEYFAIAKIQG